MPYISKQERVELNDAIEDLAVVFNELDETPQGDIHPDWEKRAGRLNYVITRLLCRVFRLDTEPKYHKINAVVGVLECVKLELYRRLAGIYEDRKIQEAGDVAEYETFMKEFMKPMEEYMKTHDHKPVRVPGPIAPLPYYPDQNDIPNPD